MALKTERGSHAGELPHIRTYPQSVHNGRFSLSQPSASIRIFIAKNSDWRKIMFDNTNLYILRTESAEGITRYYVSFTDGESIRRETEVSRPVYNEFLRFVKTERNLRRWDERHIEQSDLTDETLNRRALNPPKSVEETIFDSQRNERLRRAVAELPEIGRRRFVLYHEFGLTYEQIAVMEGCRRASVCETVLRAEEKIRDKMKNFDN
jgi:RNA polymerase sigma-70 factor (ECF subfamily)